MDEALTSLVVANPEALILGLCTTEDPSNQAHGAMLAGFDDVLFQENLDPGLLNARDAMSRGGTIKIDLAHRVVGMSATMTPVPNARRSGGGRSSGDYVVLGVEDYGTGIEPHILPRVFDPFFTTKPHESATGLGLSTVYASVEKPGGFIDISTNIGVGTRFEIFYPRDF